MTNETHDMESQSLGQFLRKTRIAQGFELEQIAEETKISGSNLKAMEADDFNSLPADAFTRGFYTIYAKTLCLAPDEIVARFLTERGTPPRKEDLASDTQAPHKAAQQVSNMAEPSSVSPMSTIGLILLLLIFLGGGICWYFNVNPATFISEKLRGIQTIEAPDNTPNDGDSGARQLEKADGKVEASTSATSTPHTSTATASNHTGQRLQQPNTANNALLDRLRFASIS